MKIKEIKRQFRRDFTAVYECEHCGFEREGGGYDDDNFHENVIPKMECPSCGKQANKNYRPLATVHPANKMI